MLFILIKQFKVRNSKQLRWCEYEGTTNKVRISYDNYAGYSDVYIGRVRI